MKLISIIVTAGLATFSGGTLAASPSGWNWDKAPAPAAPPAAIVPEPAPCAPGPDGKAPKDCPATDAGASMPDADLQESLAPPKVTGSSGNNRAKKASQ